MDLNIIQSRYIFTDLSTISKVAIDGRFECYTLEDMCRETTPGTWKSSLKVPKKTAIPYGKYQVVITFSDRFKRPLPLLLNVPDFDGIRIHGGNDSEDTEGCILPGTSQNLNRVEQSRLAFSLLFSQIERAMKLSLIHISEPTRLLSI